MVEISTLYYLVDDLNLPSDMILTQSQIHLQDEELFYNFLDLLEVDPGENLVKRTMEMLEMT
ncbi:MAG: hypothetical protein WD052_07380 [Bacteroidales bacterium]